MESEENMVREANGASRESENVERNVQETERRTGEIWIKDVVFGIPASEIEFVPGFVIYRSLKDTMATRRQVIAAEKIDGIVFND